MSCYKNGDCGAYGIYSCFECPASKPEYLNKNKKCNNDVIKNLYTLFDTAYEENQNGRGTDITRMVTTFVPDAIQNLQAYEDVFKNLNSK